MQIPPLSPEPARLDADINSVQLAPIMVLSPHYDDAVFSCGHLLGALPASIVVTVCTAHPENGDTLTDWDQRCGFLSAAEAMLTRGEENRQALKALGATGVELSFLDSQYLTAPRNSVDLLSDTLLSIIRERQPKSVFAPLGLFHTDHLLVSDAALMLEHRANGPQWFAYADIPYNKDAGRIERRVTQLAQRGIHCEPCHIGLYAQQKADAVNAYRSQFRGLGHEDGGAIMQHREQYWQLHHSVEPL